MMKKQGSIKQRLVLNRVRERQSPIKRSIDLKEGLQGVAVQSPLKIQNSNIPRKNNSSIFKRETLYENDGYHEQKTRMMKVRSISVIEPMHKMRVRSIPTIFRQPIPSQKKINDSKQKQSSVRCLSIDFLACWRDKGLVKSKSGIWQINNDIMVALLVQFAQKMAEEQFVNQTNKLFTKPLFKEFDDTSTSLKCQKWKAFRTQRVYNQIIYQSTPKLLSYQSQIMSFHARYQQTKRQKQTFWQLVQKRQREPVTEVELLFLINKHCFLKKEIHRKEQEVQQLSINEENIKEKLITKKALMISYQNKIKQHNDYMKVIDQSVKQIDTFLFSQPNRILQQEARGYKDQEQELFQLACMLEQSQNDSIRDWVLQSIMLPQQNFELSLRSFPSQPHDQKGNYWVLASDVDQFKKSIKFSYQSTISKLQSMLELKCNKIKKFVSTMRRLASYTIGKREYLTEINKKMAIASVACQNIFTKADQQSQQISLKGVLWSNQDVGQLKQLCGRMKQIYSEAQVFY